ncbi:MAG: hypothetical protein IPP17_30745 [Bacteroidetes bacterium]|nr:hypothetical protein [Bacteroidota bacterium]
MFCDRGRQGGTTPLHAFVWRWIVLITRPFKRQSIPVLFRHIKAVVRGAYPRYTSDDYYVFLDDGEGHWGRPTTVIRDHSFVLGRGDVP